MKILSTSLLSLNLSSSVKDTLPSLMRSLLIAVFESLVGQTLMMGKCVEEMGLVEIDVATGASCQAIYDFDIKLPATTKAVKTKAVQITLERRDFEEEI